MSMYGLKILYSDWPINRIERIAFPKNRYGMASDMIPGTLCLVYLTGPIKRIVTAVKITGTIADGSKNWPNHDNEYPRWPYAVPHELLMPLKQGIPLKNIREMWKPDFGPRLGDTYFELKKEIYDKFFDVLATQPVFDWAQWLCSHRK